MTVWNARRRSELTPEERHVEEKDLVLAFQEGDASAYTDIYRRYSDRVEGICRRILLDPNDVQEASQEAFLRVYRSLGKFNGRYELGAWIARIATNVCLDQLRGRIRRPQDAATLEVLDYDPQRVSEADTPETITLRKAEGRRVRSVLASLPPMHRAAIVLRDFEGLSYGEIAGALGITDTQVKALIHRARTSFKRSWTSLASSLLPVRLIQKLRGLTASNVEQTAASVSAPQIATSCSTLLHQCGQFVAERVAPIVTALAVGTGVGVAAANSPSTPPDERVTHSAVVRAAERLPAVMKVDTAKGPRHSKKATSDVARPVAEATPTPSPTPTPEEPAPAPPEGSQAGTGGSAPGGSTANPPPSPKPFLPALGFVPGPMRPSEARSNWVSFHCASASFDQRLSTSIANGDETYDASLDVEIGSAIDFVLKVYPDGDTGFDVEYAGEGSLGSRSEGSGRLLLEFTGTFVNTDDPDAKMRDLPESGNFHFFLELDCAASSVITETLELSG